MVPESLLWFLQEQAGAGGTLSLSVERTTVVDAPIFLRVLERLADGGDLLRGDSPSSYRLGAATLRLRGAGFDLDPKEWGPANAETLMKFMMKLGDLLSKPVVLGAPEALRYNPLLKGFRSAGRPRS